MAMKSSSVCALEPEKNTKNKVGPIVWDTLYLLSESYILFKQDHFISWILYRNLADLISNKIFTTFIRLFNVHHKRTNRNND